jgi:hypothetical protein
MAGRPSPVGGGGRAKTPERDSEEFNVPAPFKRITSQFEMGNPYGRESEARDRRRTSLVVAQQALKQKAGDGGWRLTLARGHGGVAPVDGSSMQHHAP